MILTGGHMPAGFFVEASLNAFIRLALKKTDL